MKNLNVRLIILCIKKHKPPQKEGKQHHWLEGLIYFFFESSIV